MRNYFIIAACVAGALLVPAAVLASHVAGVTGDGNISAAAGDQYAWNDVIGWIDFGHSTSPSSAVEVKNSQLKGYASSAAIGPIALDCATSPAPDCGSGNPWHVSNTASGKLAGWAWNDVVGWISFCGAGSSGSQWNNTNAKWECPDGWNPATDYGYSVTVDPQTGVFAGWAWNDVVGWISFCGNGSGGSTWNSSTQKWECPWGTGNPSGANPYRVVTTWDGQLATGAYLISSTFDACGTTGCTATLNSVLWYGDPLVGEAKIGFQFAVSGNVNDPWEFKGPDGSSSPLDVYSLPLGTPIKLFASVHGTGRYFKYKLFLTPCNTCTPEPTSPVVRDVIINVSP